MVIIMIRRNDIIIIMTITIINATLTLVSNDHYYYNTQAIQHASMNRGTGAETFFDTAAVKNIIIPNF